MNNATQCYLVNLVSLSSVGGIPLPSVRWEFDDVTVTSRPGLRLFNNNQVIEIERVETSDEGNFVCTATNDAGEATRTHTVVVLGNK